MASGLKYLALGDSYSIGEGVDCRSNFPSQTVRLLAEKGILTDDPIIVAKTGWTTDELMEAIKLANISETFEIVSLLIGVNNQYRGWPISNYEKEFEELVRMAIGFSGGHPNSVYVLSIPDWGITPFASGKDQAKISSEIDGFNEVNKKIAMQYHTNYFDITPSTREAATDPDLLAGDKLHPSGKEYEKWARIIANTIKPSL